MRLNDTLLLASLSLLTACSEPARPTPPERVTVAAIQMESVMGDVDGNVAKIERLVRQAAGRGARICVLPECAVCGYCDMGNDVFWGTKAEDGFMDVHTVAEPIPGPSTERLAKLADELDVYLTVPLLERVVENVPGGDEGEKERFYNSIALVGPDGTLLASHRKRIMWTVADTYCMSEGPERVCTVDTPYGRLGLMICRDVHRLVRELGEAKTDIILHCVAWYGPNSGGWFENKLAWMVQEAGVHLVLANWTFSQDPGWSGYGLSRVIAPDGKAIAKCKSDLGDEIVIAEIITPSPLREGAGGRETTAAREGNTCDPPTPSPPTSWSSAAAPRARSPRSRPRAPARARASSRWAASSAAR